MLTALSFAVILFRRGRISGHLESLHMNNFGLILRSVVWFLFPLPWLAIGLRTVLRPVYCAQ